MYLEHIAESGHCIWEPVSCSANQDIFHLLWVLKVCYCVYIYMSPASILYQMHLVHIISP
jgi:hypothetical protein